MLNFKNKLPIMLTIISCVIIISIVNISIKANKNCVSIKNEKVNNTLETKIEKSSLTESDNTIPDQQQLNKVDTKNIESVISNYQNGVYIGNIGTKKIAMTIYRNGKDLTASYITTDENDEEINMKGILNVDSATFSLFNKNNSITFDGSIKPETLEGELLSGTYKNSNDGIETEYTLVHSYSIGNTIEERYPLSDVDAEEIEAFARNIKLIILNDKKQELANSIVYPISVFVKDKKILINSPEEFEQNYDNIITTKFKNKIANCFTKYLNSNYMGIMLGNGEIWFDLFNDKGLRIYSINN